MSRSYLQADTAVKKISGYITKKVASRLDELFRADRAEFEKKWDDIRIFIIYGMLTDEKFADAAKKFLLLRDAQGKYFTLEEYRALVEAEQTDAEGNVVYLYATDPVAQHSYIEAAEKKGYNVLILDGQLDNHFVGLLERIVPKTQMVRVDSDITENLIRKNDRKVADLTPSQRAILTQMFQDATAKVDKASFMVQFEALAPDSQPVVLTQNEYMRRMKDMAAMQPGMSFYGELPDSYTLVVNTEHPLVKDITAKADSALDATVKPILEKIEADNAEITKLRSAAGDKPSAEDDQKVKDLEKAVADARTAEAEAIKAYEPSAPNVGQLVDLALLANGLLKGSNLSEFIARSIALMK